MKWSPEQRRAIQWLCVMEGLVPELSVYPDVMVRNPRTKKVKTVSIHNIVWEYRLAKQQAKKK